MVGESDMSEIDVKYYIDTVTKNGEYDVVFHSLAKMKRAEGRFYWIFLFVVVDENLMPVMDYDVDAHMVCGLTTNYYDLGMFPRANHQYIKIFKKIARYHDYTDAELFSWFPNTNDYENFRYHGHNVERPRIKVKVQFQTKGIDGQEIKPISRVTHIWNPQRKKWESTLGKSRHHGIKKPKITSLTTAQDLIDDELMQKRNVELLELQVSGKITPEKCTEIMQRRKANGMRRTNG
jgi:hypothetical protein